MPERHEVLLASGVGLQADVEVARRFHGGIIVLLVNREGEYRGIVVKDGGGAVPLMDIDIDHHRTMDAAVGLQVPNRDRHVVQHTETLAVVGKRVMEAAADVHGHPSLQRAPRGLDASSRAKKRRLDQLSRVGEFQHRLLQRGQPPL